MPPQQPFAEWLLGAPGHDFQVCLTGPSTLAMRRLADFQPGMTSALQERRSLCTDAGE